MNETEQRGFAEAVKRELFHDIVPFWCERSVDDRRGGFVGRMTNDLQVIDDAPKGLILTTRILWTFSALHRYRPAPAFRELADRAFDYLVTKFLDRTYGGMYWLLDNRGQVINNMKKIYGQAFAIFGLSEYYAAFGERDALNLAIRIFSLVEEKNYDSTNGGYFEASNRDWTIAEEMRLSESDMNERKSMNTHLHLLEAYTNLYRIWPDSELRSALRRIVDNFLLHIVDPSTQHFRMFFDDEWRPRNGSVSFGHDIEGSWLLTEAADVLRDRELSARIGQLSRNLVDATLADGFAEDCGILSERLFDGRCRRGLQWWQQAEATVGFANAWQITGEDRYLEWACKAWRFIEEHLVDRRYGEWFYEILPDRRPNLLRFKVCEWKGPYHNVRACMEIARRLSGTTAGGDAEEGRGATDGTR